MKLELIFLGWRCDCDRFVINGKQGQVEDFGAKYDRSPDKVEYCGCGNMQFTRNDPTAEVLKKYNITKADYNTICDKLEEGLSFGWCRLCF